MFLKRHPKIKAFVLAIFVTVVAVINFGNAVLATQYLINRFGLANVFNAVAAMIVLSAFIYGTWREAGRKNETESRLQRLEKEISSKDF